MSVIVLLLAGLIRLFVGASTCWCVFIACAAINQNPSLVPNGDRLSSRGTWLSPEKACFNVCVCVRERERERETPLTTAGSSGGSWRSLSTLLSQLSLPLCDLCHVTQSYQFPSAPSKHPKIFSKPFYYHWGTQKGRGFWPSATTDSETFPINIPCPVSQ